MSVCLDRFSQDPSAAAINTIRAREATEPEYCSWCGEPVYGDRDMHEKCAWEQEIGRMPFDEALNMVLERVTDAVEVSGEDNRIRFDCWFKKFEDALEVIEILEARDATYYATTDHVSFEVGAGDNWTLEFK